MRKADEWLNRQPLWRFVLITFVFCMLIWILAAFTAAWMSASHRPLPGYMGFPDGHLSASWVLMMSAISTAIATPGQVWRRRRAKERGQA